MALVVGAASGMGRDVALRLADDGYTVAVADVDGERLAVVADEVAGRGTLGRSVRIDVADPASVTEGVDEVVTALGTPWLLAVTAGVARGAVAVDLPLGILDDVMHINFQGVAHLDVCVARAMVAGGNGGRIVNWSSISAVGGTAGGSTYAASKAALDAFSKCLAVELGPYGITVNTIRPGSVDTPMLASLSDEEVAAERARIPLGRFGSPGDVAGAVAFLAGADAAWITGVALPIDGGTLAMAGRPSLEANRARFRREAETGR